MEFVPATPENIAAAMAENGVLIDAQLERDIPPTLSDTLRRQIELEDQQAEKDYPLPYGYEKAEWEPRHYGGKGVGFYLGAVYRVAFAVTIGALIVAGVVKHSPADELAAIALMLVARWY